MGAIQLPGKVKLIIGLLAKDNATINKVTERLLSEFGEADFQSGLIDFTYTDYYAKEMGSPLIRKFISFKKLADLEEIFKVKIKTNSIEDGLSVSGKRTVNIDPGYLDMAKVVLFSTKDYSHRIHISDGIFAEVTLFYKDKRYNSWPWTYPDYRTDEYIEIFNSIREIYKNQIG